MTIDKSGKWWIGSEPGDIQEYLTAWTEGGFPATEFRLAHCSCGGDGFELEADSVEGAALCTCATCEKAHFVCDSGEFWEEAKPSKLRCAECSSDQTNVGVGFSLSADSEAISWLYVGVRCVQCGVLGCFADWRVGYSPSLQLMDQV